LLVRSLIFGASGGLAEAIAHALLAREWQVDLVTRREKQDEVSGKFAMAVDQDSVRVFAVADGYAAFVPERASNAYFFTQALFAPKALVSMNQAEIAEELEIGLGAVIELTRELLLQHPAEVNERRDYCFIGSTSAYAGFRNSSVYCAVKHGLLGFVRAMNDEYADTNTRFWLFSMGTMNTAMGRRVTGQDPGTFLDPTDVAARIVEAITSRSNLFEPEVILRRRTIGYLEP
jgi:NAD(P)-dependent dehydrogenase (short-subunit alcohol dehydrogenase family)